MDIFQQIIKQQTGAEVVKEYRFHPIRRWRFDYAIIDVRVAVEINGGVWVSGRHNRGKGYLNDLEKLNHAASMGWLVLQFTPQQITDNKTIELIKEAIKK